MYKLLRPLLFMGDAESAHERMLRLGHALGDSPLARLIARWYKFEDPVLETSHWELNFKNPVGLAAGFDKNGVLLDFLPALGFGFLEAGTVTPLPQAGNDKPRLFRLPPDEAIINRMGFNNEGAAALAARLKARRKQIPVGANIGKNKVTPNENAASDYEKCFHAVANVSDYVVINVSSPNTPNLRALQDKDSLHALLTHVAELNRTRSKPLPLLLKIAPDLSDGALADITDIVRDIGLDGVIATNTTISREGLATDPHRVKWIGAGGLSGVPVRERSTEVISILYRKLGHDIPVIGVGGISSAEDAYKKIRAGAALVQVWTGLIYEGPGLVRKINEGLAEILKEDGFKSVSEAVGVDCGQ